MIDEIVVDLDDASSIELLVSEVAAVDGVSVEHVRPLDGDRKDPDLLALSVGAHLAEAAHEDRLALLCDGLIRVADADWAVVVDDDGPRAAVGSAPDESWLLAFLHGSRHLDDRAVDVTGHAPSDLVWARLPRAGLAVAAGRADRPVHDRERLRVALLARLADALLFVDR